ncbi:hypothetical protein V2J09_014205 [Rumex salicifolius]
MASSGFSFTIAVFASLIVAFHLPPTFATEFLSISPLRPPTFDDVCKEVICGNGNCSVTKNSTVPFECVCDPGWKQPNSVSGFHFLPCVMPNCEFFLFFLCSLFCEKDAKFEVAAAVNWNICGTGTCKRSSSNSSYSCSCSQGYNNFMNSTSLPCYPECALGGDCPTLNIPVFNQSNPPSPALTNAQDSTNSGILCPPKDMN